MPHILITNNSLFFSASLIYPLISCFTGSVKFPGFKMSDKIIFDGHCNMHLSIPWEQSYLYFRLNFVINFIWSRMLFPRKTGTSHCDPININIFALGFMVLKRNLLIFHLDENSLLLILISMMRGLMRELST